MLATIFTLPPEVSMKIAAGEVIEGPFSVVRELIDNALDAEARMIGITINNGGKDLIHVVDNGTGMSAVDARLSILKHTTSKIRKIEDLSGISSMGFRGEALASIVAVSDFTMTTGVAGEVQGTRLVCEAGGDIEEKPAPANTGTVVSVRNLFRNLPARKKFLKSNRAEAVKVKDEILKKAIGFPECGFLYKSDDRVLFNLDPVQDRVQRLADLYGGSFRSNLLQIEYADELFTIDGYISNHLHSLPNRRGQYLYINGRPVADRSLYHAVNSPCRSIVPAGRYIYAFVFIVIDPALVDVNVHPAKREVKIKPADRLYSALHHCVGDALSRGYYGVRVVSEREPLERSVYGQHGTGGSQQVTDHGSKKSRFESHAAGYVVSRAFNIVRETIDEEPEILFHLNEDSLTALQYRGSLFNCFLVFEGPDQMLLVDQHAAHERINYERFGERTTGEEAVKNLLIPINFTPPPGKYGDLLDALDSFREAGIEIEPFGDESFNIVALPAFIPDNREEETVSVLFDEYCSGRIRQSAQDIRDNFLKLASCRNAIRDGDAVGNEEARTLIRDLFATRTPYVCPHGRPTMVRYSREYLDRLFRRR
jgi:DNA mismatch repair protein MutL